MKIRLLALLSLAGLSLLSMVQPSNAQNVPAINQQNYDKPNNDPFYQGTEQSPFNMFQMIHNAQLGINGYNPEYFQQQSQELDEAAAAFRKRQQQMMQNGSLGNTQNTGTILQPLPQQGSQIIKLESSK
jgi:hypothetical protein